MKTHLERLTDQEKLELIHYLNEKYWEETRPECIVKNSFRDDLYDIVIDSEIAELNNRLTELEIKVFNLQPTNEDTKQEFVVVFDEEKKVETEGFWQWLKRKMLLRG